VKKAVFWDVAPCRCGVNPHFGGMYRLHLQGRSKNKKMCKQTNVGNKLSYMRAGKGGDKSTLEISGEGQGKGLGRKARLMGGH
jgi:hypothetical protein